MTTTAEAGAGSAMVAMVRTVSPRRAQLQPRPPRRVTKPPSPQAGRRVSLLVNGTHASFFSGVGGTDLGLERAGWRTVSFSEIDPYACAVLAERWPGVPNLGDIVSLQGPLLAKGGDADGSLADWRTAQLWTGGFP